LSGRTWDSQEHADLALYGGTPEMRVKHGRAPTLESPLLLDPVRSLRDAEGLRQFLAHPAVMIEIGFGKGRFLRQLASGFPAANVVGIEVKTKYARIALDRLARAGTSNCRVVIGDARLVLSQYVAPASVDAVFLMFPDPWWKARHFRRRLLDAAFLPVLESVLKPGGTVLVRSDVPMVLQLAREAFQGSAVFGEADVCAFDEWMTDREVACRGRGIPVEQACFRHRE